MAWPSMIINSGFPEADSNRGMAAVCWAMAGTSKDGFGVYPSRRPRRREGRSVFSCIIQQGKRATNAGQAIGAGLSPTC